MSNEMKEIIRISKSLTKHMINDKKSIESIIIKKLLDRKINELLTNSN